jgi:hypothetical protein
MGSNPIPSDNVMRCIYLSPRFFIILAFFFFEKKKNEKNKKTLITREKHIKIYNKKKIEEGACAVEGE